MNPTREDLLGKSEEDVVNLLTGNNLKYKVIVRDNTPIGWIDKYVEQRYSLHIMNNVVYEVTFG